MSMTIAQVKRGEVYYANLDPVVGSETGKTRPVVVIQNDIGNQYSPTTIVAIITAYSDKKATYPICVAVGADQGYSLALD
jgi:mRNA interferase MazF